MKVENLKSKLAKMNVPFKVSSNNGYNKDIEFTINGKKFYAGFTEGKEAIEDYCRVIGYDKGIQETQRAFYSNFNEVLRASKR